MIKGNKELKAAGFPVKRGMTGGGESGRVTSTRHSEPFMGEESMDPSYSLRMTDGKNGRVNRAPHPRIYCGDPHPGCRT